MIINYERCIELAQKRLRDIITAANKADPQEMTGLMCSSLCSGEDDYESGCFINEQDAAKWQRDGNCINGLIIGKFQFNVEELIAHDACPTDKYVLFGPDLVKEAMSEEEYYDLLDETRSIAGPIAWQYDSYTIDECDWLLEKAMKCLKDNNLM